MSYAYAVFISSIPEKISVAVGGEDEELHVPRLMLRFDDFEDNRFKDYGTPAAITNVSYDAKTLKPIDDGDVRYHLLDVLASHQVAERLVDGEKVVFRAVDAQGGLHSLSLPFENFELGLAMIKACEEVSAFHK